MRNGYLKSRIFLIGKRGEKMNILEREKKLCISCMGDHFVDLVNEIESITFKGEKVEYNAIYEYCEKTESYLETEEMMRVNEISIRDAYREKMNLLTTKQIKEIRAKYRVNQKNFAKILGWGEATMARYESFFVQDRANDNVLRKIDIDPEWFLSLLINIKGKITDKSYKKYLEAATIIVDRKKQTYTIKSVISKYVEIDSIDYKTTSFTNYMERIYKTICTEENKYTLNTALIPNNNNSAA